MAVLPIKKAKELGDIMAKNGVSGAIAMKSPKPSYDDESGDDKPEVSELESCASDLADAISGGDKDAIKSAIMDLVDCIKHDDQDSDEDQLGA